MNTLHYSVLVANPCAPFTHLPELDSSGKNMAAQEHSF